jgi:hypothetical protein
MSRNSKKTGIISPKLIRQLGEEIEAAKTGFLPPEFIRQLGEEIDVGTAPIRLYLREHNLGELSFEFGDKDRTSIWDVANLALGLTKAQTDQMPISRLAEKFRQLRGSKSGTASFTTKVIRPNAERDEWLYRQYVDQPKKTLATIRREAKSKKWLLSSDQTLRKAVKSHCDSVGIDMPRRNNKRT